MIRMQVLYPAPPDEAAFLSHYKSTHAPLVKKLAKLSRYEYGKVLPGFDGSAPPYFFHAELVWQSADDMMADFTSPDGAATTVDLPNLQVEPITFLAETNS